MAFIRLASERGLDVYLFFTDVKELTWIFKILFILAESFVEDTDLKFFTLKV